MEGSAIGESQIIILSLAYNSNLGYWTVQQSILLYCAM